MRLNPPLKKIQGYWLLVIPLMFPEYTLNGPKMFCGAVYDSQPFKFKQLLFWV